MGEERLDLTRNDLLVLGLLMDRPMHGYEILQQIRAPRWTFGWLLVRPPFTTPWPNSIGEGWCWKPGRAARAGSAVSIT